MSPMNGLRAQQQPLNTLLPGRNDPALQGKWGSPRFVEDLVKKVYVSSIRRIVDRLVDGGNVLVVAPGACLDALGELVGGQVQKRTQAKWHVVGRPPSQATTLNKEWDDWTNLFGHIAEWRETADTGAARRPGFLFTNLDLTANERQEVETSPTAKNALWALAECTRLGGVLGLADRSGPAVPTAVSRYFDEESRFTLDELPTETFHHLIPQRLGKAFARESYLSGVVIQTLALRLRWTDPLRVVRILDDVATNLELGDAGQGDLAKVLAAIGARVCPVQFEPPSVVAAPSARSDESLALTQIRAEVLEPFKAWLGTSGHTSDEQANDLARRRLPSGLILHGPPGTGKTSIARWLVGELDLPVQVTSAAQIKASGYGDAERNMRDLLRAARRAAPCVLVLDDADDLLPDRRKVTGAVAGAEVGIVNAFLQELEGTAGRLEGVLIVLTTNRFTELDPAAQDRMKPHVRVPYPLTDTEVGAIVDVVASELGLELSEIRGTLAERFFDSVRPGQPGGPIKTAEYRYGLDAGLFSPREIRDAMRILLPGTRGQVTIYKPTQVDVERMNKHYAWLSRTAQGGPYR